MIRPLTDLTFRQRLTLAVVIIAAVLVLMALFWHFLVPAEAEPVPDLYADVPSTVEMLEIDRGALNEAYHGQLVKLFSIWLSDGAKDATRFRNGLRIARAAYKQASDQIDRREQQLHR